ncbi:BON domain-containing protein [Microbacterium sulfonylureivorans]|uniref:BON domain-containing protein n=1 Tax=Microbacterium sulfonylureivorans TaxID=2486854 RepID=UPI000FDBE9E9|nr:BON domain-containing protein [Microbacterium sulfonylureivorans]
MSTAAGRDRDVQSAVYAELDWTPDIQAAGIGVGVVDDVVTLSGEVDRYAERVAAKRAALRVKGVRAVIDHLTVHPRGGWPVGEAEIAKAVDRALNISAKVPETVKAEVNGHTVTLTGEAEWNYQRTAAKHAVRDLPGVSDINNMITLTPRPTAADTADRIRRALTRNALLDARSIAVTAAGDTVTLMGTVQSWAEKRQAEQAAWASPHVAHVDNQIVVSGL